MTAELSVNQSLPSSWSLLRRDSAVWSKRLKHSRCLRWAHNSRRPWYCGGSWKSSLCSSSHSRMIGTNVLTVKERNTSVRAERRELMQTASDCTDLRRQMVLSRETVDSSLWKSKHKDQPRMTCSVIIAAQTRWRPGGDREPAADPASKLHILLDHRFAAVSQSAQRQITADAHVI